MDILILILTLFVVATISRFFNKIVTLLITSFISYILIVLTALYSNEYLYYMSITLLESCIIVAIATLLKFLYTKIVNKVLYSKFYFNCINKKTSKILKSKRLKEEDKHNKIDQLFLNDIFYSYNIIDINKRLNYFKSYNNKYTDYYINEEYFDTLIKGIKII